MTWSFEPLILPTPEELEARVSAVPQPESRAGGHAGATAAAGAVELPELTMPSGRPLQPQVVVPPQPTPQVEALEEAKTTAHQQGFEEGRRAEAERVRTLVEAVNSIVHELSAADQRRELESIDRITVLATAIAGHIIGREVKVAPEVLADLVRRAVAEFGVNEGLTVHLNPSDLALLSSGLTDHAAGGNLASGKSVRWVPDPAIRSGGCLVEGGDRIVDARLEGIFERVFRALTDD